MLTLSIGVGHPEASPASAQQLLEQADGQLSMAKRTGRNRVCATVLRARLPSRQCRSQHPRRIRVKASSNTE